MSGPRSCRHNRKLALAKREELISITTFADSSKMKTRCSKGISNINYLDIESVDVSEEDEDEERIVHKKKMANNKKEEDVHLSHHHMFNVYPLDLWTLLGDHIWPESVQTFSLLCKQTLHVTRSRRFWINLYTRHVRSDLGQALVSTRTPLQLPLSVLKEQTSSELRSIVVKALFLVHPPLTARLRCNWMVAKELEGRVCVSEPQVERCSTSSSRSHYHYTFVMARPIKVFQSIRRSSKSQSKGTPSTWEALDDPCILKDRVEEFRMEPLVNQDEFVVKFELVTASYAPLPSISGLKLINVSQSVCGSHFQMLKLTLTFDSTHKRVQSQASVLGGEVVCLQNVISARILPWFHPHFESRREVTKDEDDSQW